METDPLDYCLDNHDRTGIMTTHPESQPGRDDAHAAVSVCMRRECQEAAGEWIRDATGLTATFVPDQRVGQTIPLFHQV